MSAIVVNAEKNVTQDGVATKPLYIKHFALTDWEILNRLRVQLGGKSVADAVRFAIRKAGGVI